MKQKKDHKWGGGMQVLVKPQEKNQNTYKRLLQNEILNGPKTVCDFSDPISKEEIEQVLWVSPIHTGPTYPKFGSTIHLSWA